MPEGRMVRQDDERNEKLKLDATKKVDKELLSALTTDEGGPLAAGALPNIKADSAAGQIAVLEALAGDGEKVVKVKKAKKEKTESTEVEPKTVLQYGPQEPVLVCRLFHRQSSRIYFAVV